MTEAETPVKSDRAVQARAPQPGQRLERLLYASIGRAIIGRAAPKGSASTKPSCPS
jgi:hypothetical protein